MARRILGAALDGRLAGAVSAGLRVAAGTDAGNNHTPHGWSLHRELHLLRAAGLTGDQVLAAATSVAADTSSPRAASSDRFRHLGKPWRKVKRQ